MIVGQELLIDKTIAIHDLGVVEVTEFENLSSATYYKEVAERPSRYHKRHFTTKQVVVKVRVLEENREEAKAKIDEIVGLSYTGSPIEFYLDNQKWCLALLEKADSSLLFKSGLIELEFTNIFGYWLGDEKTSSGGRINNASFIDTSHMVIEFTASEQTVTISNSTQNEELILTGLLVGSKHRVDCYDKTAKHVITEDNQLSAEIDLASDFIKLLKGDNSISVTGAADVVIKYREVVAL